MKIKPPSIDFLIKTIGGAGCGIVVFALINKVIFGSTYDMPHIVGNAMIIGACFALFWRSHNLQRENAKRMVELLKSLRRYHISERRFRTQRELLKELVEEGREIIKKGEQLK